MCDWEAIHFKCGHSMRRLFRYCHFARNDINHQCMGPWALKREWNNPYALCDRCYERIREQEAQQAQNSSQQRTGARG